MKIATKIFFLSILLCGCGSLIKSEYPPTSFYRLSEQPLSYHPGDSIRGTLLIRAFTTNSEYFSEHLQTTDNGYQLKQYFYHRWVGLPEEMVTDFISDRFSRMNLFEGVVSSSSIAVPNYIMEGKLLEFIARNDNKGAGTADLRVQISLVRTQNTDNENPMIMQKIYERKIPRKDGSQQAIAEAMSRALAELTDEVAEDIFNALSPGRSGMTKAK